uniref:Uncharacterized protein n=1 Tax=Meloidogyne enterolobii TaxID=390850 RepID=A0A6V7XW93_MELEN|nr:unnamed protein product [Meloidogyne enterolobii]
MGCDECKFFKVELTHKYIQIKVICINVYVFACQPSNFIVYLLNKNA